MRHEPGRAENRGRSVGELEIEAPPDGDHEIRVALSPGRAWQSRRMGDRRDEALAFAGIKVRSAPRRSSSAVSSAAGSACATAGDHEWALRRPYDSQPLPTTVSSSGASRGSAWDESVRELHGARHLAA